MSKTMQKVLSLIQESSTTHGHGIALEGLIVATELSVLGVLDIVETLQAIGLIVMRDGRWIAT